MSLRSRKSIGKAGPDKHDEVVVTFRKESDGTYTKIKKVMSRDWKTGGIKQMKKIPTEESGPFSLVSVKDSYDETVEYEDFDGKTKLMYFKKMNDEAG